MNQAAQEVYDALREEWDALACMSYHGTSWGSFAADLNTEDIARIRKLLADAASTIEAFSCPDGMSQA